MKIKDHSESARRSSSLSEFERNLSDLVAQGCSNREIAATLCVDEPTVQEHAHNVLEKLDGSRRLDLALCALHRASPMIRTAVRDAT